MSRRRLAFLALGLMLGACAAVGWRWATAPMPLDRAESIWLAQARTDTRNIYACFRLERNLPARARSALVRVTARDRYALYVNGHLAARGPARCWPEQQAYDLVDLLPWLPASGPVVFAALVHHEGVDTFSSVNTNHPGFWLEGAVETDAGVVILHTGSQWRAHPATAWDPQAPRINVQRGFCEYYDARRESHEWQEPGFSARDWSRAAVVSPWPALVARETDMPSECTHLPSAIQSSGVFAATSAPLLTGENVARRLNGEIVDSAVPNPTQQTESLLSATGTCTLLPPPEAGAPFLLLDFGQVRFARLRLRVTGAKGGEIVDIGYGEQLFDGRLRPSLTTFSTTTDLADRYICRAGDQEWQSFDARGFRYTLLVFRNLSQPVQLLSVQALEEFYPGELVGRFEASDPLLTEAWQTSVRTLRACMTDSYIDGPWREAAQWMADAWIGARVNYVSLGETRLIARTLRQAVERTTRDGLFLGVFPTAEPPGLRLVVPDYCLLWVIAQAEYYEYSGDDRLLRDLWPSTRSLLHAIGRRSGPSGLIEHDYQHHWLLLDAEGLPPMPWNEPFLSATYNLLYVWALRQAVSIARVVGETESALLLEGRAAYVTSAIRQTFFDLQSGQLWERAGISGARMPDGQAVHPAALALLLQLDGERAQMWGDLLVNPGTLPLPSIYFHSIVLDALCVHGRVEDAVGLIRRRWGPLLRSGARTWPEFWDGRGSQCHLWGGAPAATLSRFVLGVRPVAPGFRRVRVDPQPCGLEWASGTVPTPHGPLHIDWRVVPGGLAISLVVPAGVVAEWADGTTTGPGRYERTLPLP